jgi:hypothetical protein
VKKSKIASFIVDISFSFRYLRKIPDTPSRELHFPAKHLCRETAGKPEGDATGVGFMAA